MKFASVVVLCVFANVVFSEELTTYIMRDDRCMDVPKNDVCAAGKMPGGGGEDFANMMNGIKSLNTSLTFSQKCKNSIMKAFCDVYFSKCNSEGKFVETPKSTVDSVCQNKLPLPADSGCNETLVNDDVSIKANLLGLCVQHKTMSQMMVCVDYGDYVVPPCKKVSYKGPNITRNETETKEGLSAIEQLKSAIKEECYEGIMTEVCDMGRPVCTKTDQGYVWSTLSNQKKCKDNLKCFAQMDTGDICDHLPGENAKTFTIDDDTSGQAVIQALPVLLASMTLFVKNLV